MTETATPALYPDMKAILSHQSREEFAASQMQMTQSWYDNLVKSGRNVGAHIAQRKRAYLDRWREAGRYFGAGGKVLDVGGGNLYDELFAYFKSMGWDYWYADVGDAETLTASQMGEKQGFDPSHFSQRLNHELDYEEAAFDSIFSSHCIEHSMDLPLTLRQMNRILKPGGNLVASIPFGFDAQPNHPYFLAENEWLTLIEDAGFDIRAYQIGSEYPESGQDLMIAARKARAPADRFRVDVAAYTKTNYAFRAFNDPSLTYRGVIGEPMEYVILDGDWRIDIPLGVGVTEVLPVFSRHNWSGKACVRSGADAVYADLFRPQTMAQVVRLNLSTPASAGQIAQVLPAGRSDLSRAAQAVFMGVMTR